MRFDEYPEEPAYNGCLTQVNNDLFMRILAYWLLEVLNALLFAKSLGKELFLYASDKVWDSNRHCECEFLAQLITLLELNNEVYLFNDRRGFIQVDLVREHALEVQVLDLAWVMSLFLCLHNQLLIIKRILLDSELISQQRSILCEVLGNLSIQYLLIEYILDLPVNFLRWL
jgi:hypothetical protein